MTGSIVEWLIKRKVHHLKFPKLRDSSPTHFLLSLVWSGWWRVGGAKEPRREMATLASRDVYHFVTTTVNTLI